MAAGIAALDLLVERNPYPRLEAMGKRMQEALLQAAQSKGMPLQVPQTGSMFGFFFSETPVTNFPEVMATETGLFKKLFKEALKRDVYLPPSPFETCFISTAHDDGDLDKAIEGLTDAIKVI